MCDNVVRTYHKIAFNLLITFVKYLHFIAIKCFSHVTVHMLIINMTSS
jgi:hypothetical protein